jgi:hypothetical protein
LKLPKGISTAQLLDLYVSTTVRWGLKFSPNSSQSTFDAKVSTYFV